MNISIDPKKFPPGIKVAIYCRVSSKGQAEKGQGLDFQKKYCQDIANKYGWIVYKNYFNPNGISGAIFPDKRPEFMEMIKDAISKKFIMVLTFSLDRLGRTTGSAEMAKEMIYNLGLELCVEGQLLPTSITGRFYTGIHSTMVAFEKAMITERLEKGMEEAKKMRGETRGGIPYGYIKLGEGKKSRIEIDEHRAKVVQIIYELRYKGNKSLNCIAKYLNEKEIKPPRSEKWTHSKVSEFLKASRMKMYRGCLRNDGNELGIRWPVILGPEYDEYIDDVIDDVTEMKEMKVSQLQPLLPSKKKDPVSESLIPPKISEPFESTPSAVQAGKIKGREKISEFIPL